MKKPFYYLIISVIGVLVSTAAVFGITYAQNGGNLGFRFGDLPKHEAMQNALENNDYQAWLEIVGEDSPMAEIINEDNFAKFAEMHALKSEGNFEEAREIWEALGLGFKHGKRGLGKGNFSPEQKEAIKTALENNDYQAWLEAVGEDCPLAESINEDNFAKLVKVHALKEEGNFEEAREIWEELGLAGWKGPRWGK